MFTSSQLTRNQALEKISAVEALASSSTGIGVIYDCALDNAGFDGMANVLHTLSDDDLREILRHIVSIWDGQMADCATQRDYELLASWINT